MNATLQKTDQEGWTGGYTPLSDPLLVQRPEMLPEPGSLEEKVIARLAAQAREICGFCISQGKGKVFAEDTDGRIFFRYVTFHLLHGNILVVRQSGQICGVAFAWPDVARDVLMREQTGEPFFNWRPAVRGGDCVVVAQTVGNRAAAFGWRKLALDRWPDFYQRRIFGHRAGHLVELDYRLVRRFCRGGNHGRA